MGGYEGVLDSQSCALTTLQPGKGLWCKALPRARSLRRMASDALPHLPRDSLAALPEHPDQTRAVLSLPCAVEPPMIYATVTETSQNE
jgi:hypothetical protein